MKKEVFDELKQSLREASMSEEHTTVGEHLRRLHSEAEAYRATIERLRDENVKLKVGICEAAKIMTDALTVIERKNKALRLIAAGSHPCASEAVAIIDATEDTTNS